MTDLDVSINTELTELVCCSNALEDLDVSSNIALQVIDCSNNELVSLNLQNGNNTNIQDYSISGERTSFSDNLGLECIQVDDPAYAYANNWDINYLNSDSDAYFSSDCGYALSTNNLDIEAFSIYPNPVENTLIIHYNDNFDTAEIVSLEGKLLTTSKEK